MKTVWQVQPEAPEEFLARAPEGQRLIWQVLHNRGIRDASDAELFLNPTRGGLHDPYKMSDIEKAAELILKAVEGGKRIVVHGDYDADGVMATVLIVETLRELGARVDYYIPHRERDGYGMRLEKVEELAGKNDLLITVDCGVTNIEEVKVAKQKGMSVVITDHHQIVGDIPEADAVVNPNRKDDNYPFKELSGAGVAFKLLQVLHEKSGGKTKDPFYFIDLVSLATVGDCMDLVNENRILVSEGMEKLRGTKRKGLLELMRYAGIDVGKINSYSLAFQIVPRLNAAGRMGHAREAFNLLVEGGPDRAQDLAYNLNKKNRERQNKVQELLSAAREQILAGGQNKTVLVAEGEDWPVGLVGLVAGKLAEEFGKPAFVMGKIGDDFVGSARGLEGFHVTRALDQARDLLLKYGGHEAAGGFTLSKDKLEEFKETLESNARDQLAKDGIVKKIPVDSRLSFGDLNLELAKKLWDLEPFGLGNPEPRFLMEGVRVAEARGVGVGGKHLKMKLSGGGVDSVDAIGFNLGSKAGSLEIGQSVDILGKVDVNEWNGREGAQMKVEGIRRNN